MTDATGSRQRTTAGCRCTMIIWFIAALILVACNGEIRSSSTATIETRTPETPLFATATASATVDQIRATPTRTTVPRITWTPRPTSTVDPTIAAWVTRSYIPYLSQTPTPEILPRRTYAVVTSPLNVRETPGLDGKFRYTVYGDEGKPVSLLVDPAWIVVRKDGCNWVKLSEPDQWLAMSCGDYVYATYMIYNEGWSQ